MWRDNMDSINIGDIIRVTVTGIQNYGAFVMINEEYDGLIHISEISKDYVKDINDYVKIGDLIYAEVIDYDEESNKYKLSIKNINYKDGSKIEDENSNEGFLPLKEHLDLWMNEKIKEIMDKM